MRLLLGVLGVLGALMSASCAEVAVLWRASARGWLDEGETASGEGEPTSTPCLGCDVLLCLRQLST